MLPRNVLAILVVGISGCGLSQRTPTAPTPTPENGHLQIFQRAIAPREAEAYVTVRDVRAASTIVEGRFPVRGLELELPPGTYRVTTWFPSDTDATRRCERDAIVASRATTAFVRVQDDATDCRFEPGEGEWNVALRRGRMKASSWWVGLGHDGDAEPFLELGMPLPVSAVFLDVEPETGGSFRKLWIAASLVWEDAAVLKACTGGSGTCASLYDGGGCRSSVRASELEHAESTELFVQRLDGASRSVHRCLITD